MDWQAPTGWDEWQDRLRAVGIHLGRDRTSWDCPKCGKRHALSSEVGGRHLCWIEDDLTVKGVVVGPATATLTGEEAVAMDHLLKAAEVIFGWKPKGNHAELGTAIHVLQGFIVQHMLHRLNPAHWNSWYEEEGG